MHMLRAWAVPVRAGGGRGSVCESVYERECERERERVREKVREILCGCVCAPLIVACNT